jgi:hypothetical protein
MPSVTPCPHLERGKLDTAFVLDDYLGIAEAVTRCAHCDQYYVLELLDISGSARAWRLAPLDAASASALIHDLTRGSCDVNRAATQIHAIKSQCPLCDCYISSATGSLSDLHVHKVVNPLPVCAWRELPLDGAWIRQMAQSG